MPGLRLCDPPIGKALFDLGFDHFRVEIAHNNQHSVLRHIFAFPKPLKAGRIGSLNGLLRANRQALWRKRIGVSKFQAIDEIFERIVRALTTLSQNNAFLSLNCISVKGQLTSGFAHQHQRCIKQRFIRARQIELILRALKSGRSIGVGAKGQAEPFEQFDHLAFGHIGRAIERHMLDVMGKAALFIALIEGACVNFHPHKGSVLGPIVAPDDIAHAII